MIHNVTGRNGDLMMITIEDDITDEDGNNDKR